MIETERLLLRPWRTGDAGALYKYASDSRVSDMALWPRHTSVEMSLEIIETVFMPNPECFALIFKESDEPIGCMGLVPRGDEHYAAQASEREVGYWIGYPYWNMGFATEALRALIDYCIDSPDMESLLITTDARNSASRRVAEKCGFKWVKDYLYNGTSSRAYRLNL